MKINLLEVIKDWEGKPVKLVSEDGKSEKDLILKKVLLDMCGANNPQEQLNGEEKIIRYKIGLKVANSEGEVDLSSEDIVKLKSLLKQYASTVVCGRALDILEPLELK